jgi:hypothetical protein
MVDEGFSKRMERFFEEEQRIGEAGEVVWYGMEEEGMME